MRSAERIRYLILAAQREGNRRLAAALSAIDLTPAQSEALRIIEDHGPLSLKQLGDMLVCDSGTNPSRIADRLVTNGLVKRSAGRDDRRQIRLTITPEGEVRAALVRGIEEQVYDAIDQTVGGDDARLLVRLLESLTEAAPARAALDARLAADEGHGM
ncbi:MAG: MarR family transcriptional regulator [Mycetocola sp.]